MTSLGPLLLLLAASVEPTPPPPARSVQPVYATVTIIAVEPVDTKTLPQRGSAQASARQDRVRDRMPLVEFY